MGIMVVLVPVGPCSGRVGSLHGGGRIARSIRHDLGLSTPSLGRGVCQGDRAGLTRPGCSVRAVRAAELAGTQQGSSWRPSPVFAGGLACSAGVLRSAAAACQSPAAAWSKGMGPRWFAFTGGQPAC